MIDTEDTILTVNHLTKKYFVDPRLGRKPGYVELLRMMAGLSPNSEKLRGNEFYALRDISFSLRRGEAVGIMGMNGAGKSTLLKVILGRLPLDSGSFSVAGSVGGLVELNAGFHNEMTGIENIYNRARLLGKSDSEVRDRIDGIIDFADIGKFIDSPVKTYSSGMTVRLGFAIAIHFVEDLVLCDEILAVGDFDFRQKCLEKINELRSRKSFVLVSHSTTDISNFCNRAILLHKGEMILEGVPEKVIEAYALCDHHLTAVEVRNVIKESTKQIKIRSGEVEGVKVPEKPKRKKLFIENPNLNGFVGWTLDAKWTNPSLNSGILTTESNVKEVSFHQEIERIANFKLLLDVEPMNCHIKVLGLCEGGNMEILRHEDRQEYLFNGYGLKLVFSRHDTDINELCKIRRFEVLLDQEEEKSSEVSITETAKSSLFGPEYHRANVIQDVGLSWNLRWRNSGFYYVAGDIFELKISYFLNEAVDNLRIGIPFFNSNGEMVIGPDTRSYEDKNSLCNQGFHEVMMQLNPLPINSGRLWLVLTFCQDPAHLYRKHISGFDVVNAKNEYGLFYTVPNWGGGKSGDELNPLTL